MYYRVYLSTKINAKDMENRSGMIAMEPSLYTKGQIKAVKAKGYALLAYLSVGTNEKERSWWNKYKKYNLQRLDDWPNEYYVDVRKIPWIDHLVEQAKKYRDKGFDGIWADNLDVYEYNKSASMFNGCLMALTKLKEVGGYIMVNGGSEFFDKAMDKKIPIYDVVNGVTQEEVFSLITDYDGKGKFGKQEKEQSKWYQKYMIRLHDYGLQTFLLEYTRNAALKKTIKTWCKNNEMTGYYISGDVDL